MERGSSEDLLSGFKIPSHKPLSEDAMIQAKAEQRADLRQSFPVAFFFSSSPHRTSPGLHSASRSRRTVGRLRDRNSSCIPYVPAIRDFTKRVTSVDHSWH